MNENGEGLGKCRVVECAVVRKTSESRNVVSQTVKIGMDEYEYSRMENVCWVIHAVLESAVEVWEGLCAAAESHVLAEVVATLGAVVAVVAHDACLYCDTLTDDKVLYSRSHRCHDASCFMTEYERRLESKVSVASVNVVMHWGGCHTLLGRHDTREYLRSLPQRPVPWTATCT